MGGNDRDIILDIYDTVADASRWPDILDRIAHQVDAKGCIIFQWEGHEANRKLVLQHYSGFFNPSLLDRYMENWSQYEFEDQDIFERHSLRSDAIDVLDDSVIASNVAILKQRPNVQFFLKYGLLHRAGVLLDKDNRSRSRFSMQFDANHGRPSSDQIGQLQVLLPHIAKALSLGQPSEQLAQRQLGLFSAIERLALGVCVIDAHGNVIVKNTEFTRQLEDYPVFYLTPSGGLRLTRAQDQKRFSTMLNDVNLHGHHGARPRKEALATDEENFLCIELVPLNHAQELGSKAIGGAILYSADTSKPLSCNSETIGIAFGLTETERELMSAIADGLTNGQIAELRGRSVDTINAQVKSILGKTSCANRTQLVRLMMNFGVDFVNP